MSSSTSDGKPYSYTEAGFDGFFRRTLGSTNQAQTLKQAAQADGSRINFRFDDQQTSGSMGDAITAGTIKIDGKTGRIVIADDQGNEVVRLGSVND